MIFVEQALRGDFAARDNFVKRIEEALLAVPRTVQPRTRFQPRIGDFHHFARYIMQGAAAR